MTVLHALTFLVLCLGMYDKTMVIVEFWLLFGHLMCMPGPNIIGVTISSIYA